MSKLQNLLTSRTFWTMAVMFLLSGFQALQGSMPDGLYVAIMGILTALAGYFKVNPSKEY